jgi:hypothetical protein
MLGASETDGDVEGWDAVVKTKSSRSLYSPSTHGSMVLF